MRNAHSTIGGVDYCQLPTGFTVTCNYSFSGIDSTDGHYYSCTGSLGIRGVYSEAVGWQTYVDRGIGPQCY